MLEKIFDRLGWSSRFFSSEILLIGRKQINWKWNIV
jgi:urease accessory protein UreH